MLFVLLGALLFFLSALLFFLSVLLFFLSSYGFHQCRIQAIWTDVVLVTIVGQHSGFANCVLGLCVRVHSMCKNAMWCRKRVFRVDGAKVLPDEVEYLQLDFKFRQRFEHFRVNPKCNVVPHVAFPAWAASLLSVEKLILSAVYFKEALVNNDKVRNAVKIDISFKDIKRHCWRI